MNKICRHVLIILLVLGTTLAAAGCGRQEKAPSARILEAESCTLSAYTKKTGVAESKREPGASYRLYFYAEATALWTGEGEMILKAEDFSLKVADETYIGLSFLEEEKTSMEDRGESVLLEYRVREEQEMSLVPNERTRLLVSFALPPEPEGGAYAVYSFFYQDTAITAEQGEGTGGLFLFQETELSAERLPIGSMPEGEMTVSYAPVDEINISAEYRAVTLQTEIAEERIFSADEFVLTANGKTYPGKYFLTSKTVNATSTSNGRALTTEVCMVTRTANMPLEKSQSVSLTVAFDIEKIPGDFSVQFVGKAK